MEFKLTKEQELIQRAAREYAEKTIVPQVEAIVESGKVPESILRDLKQLDFFAIPVPEEYGGAGAGYVSYALVLEQLARVLPALSVIISVNNVGLAAIENFGTEEQKKRYMPPGGSGDAILSLPSPSRGPAPTPSSSPPRRSGRATPLFSTGRSASSRTPVIPAPSSSSRRRATRVPSAAFFDKFTEGYSVSEPWKKMGAPGGPLYDVYLKDVVVPAENMLGGPNKGFWVLKVALALGKIGVSSMFLGCMLAAYEEALKYATQKTHRGQPIVKFQAIQMAISDMAMKYEASRWLTYRAGWLADNAKDKGESSRTRP